MDIRVQDRQRPRQFWSQQHLVFSRVLIVGLCSLFCVSTFARVESDLFWLGGQATEDLVDATAFNSCQAWRDVNEAPRHAESLLIQSSLGYIQRQADTLSLNWKKHRYQLVDQCDDHAPELRVAYLLQDIRHLQLSWVVSEQTAHRIRYLLIDPEHDHQLVLPAMPSFSPDQQRMIMIHETVQNDTVQQSMQIYHYNGQQWIRQYEQSRIQVCETCQNNLWQAPQIEWLTNQQIQIELTPIRMDDALRPVVRRLRLYQQPDGKWQRSDGR